jgi:hypothetical protein
VQEKHIQWEAGELTGIVGRSYIKDGIDYAEYLFARIFGQIFCLADAVLPVVAKGRVSVDEVGQLSNGFIPLDAWLNRVEIFDVSL